MVCLVQTFPQSLSHNVTYLNLKQKKQTHGKKNDDSAFKSWPAVHYGTQDTDSGFSHYTSVRFGFCIIVKWS